MISYFNFQLARIHRLYRFFISYLCDKETQRVKKETCYTNVNDHNEASFVVARTIFDDTQILYMFMYKTRFPMQKELTPANFPVKGPRNIVMSQFLAYSLCNLEHSNIK